MTYQSQKVRDIQAALNQIQGFEFQSNEVGFLSQGGGTTMYTEFLLPNYKNLKRKCILRQ